jgi:hypothetical protein
MEKEQSNEKLLSKWSFVISSLSNYADIAQTKYVKFWTIYVILAVVSGVARDFLHYKHTILTYLSIW